MATTVKTIAAPNTADLITAVDAYLATLTNPIIRKFDLFMNDAPFRVGIEYRVLIVTDTGGSALATPWQMDVAVATGMGALQTALQAVYDAQPTYFWGGPDFSVNDENNGKIPRYTAALLYNVTNNAAALANYALR